MPKIEVQVYWGLDDNNKVVIDEDEIRKSFDQKLQAVKDDTEGFSENVINNLKDEIYG
tara:strand:- start:21 stop:194 length:174 start_codon:yes stop_codon:yes gene_type:complete